MFIYVKSAISLQTHWRSGWKRLVVCCEKRHPNAPNKPPKCMSITLIWQSTIPNNLTVHYVSMYLIHVSSCSLLQIRFQHLTGVFFYTIRLFKTCNQLKLRKFFVSNSFFMCRSIFSSVRLFVHSFRSFRSFVHELKIARA